MMFMLIDFEATGVDTNNDRITEIGARLGTYSCGSHLIDSTGFSTLVYDADYPELTPEVEELTGIDTELLKVEGVDFCLAVQKLLDYIGQSVAWPAYFVAHNKGYDEQLFRAEMRRHKSRLLDAFDQETIDKLWATPWLCTIDDVKWAPRYKCKKLSHLALDLGIPVDPSTLHRALGDLMLMAEMFTKKYISIPEMIVYSKIPWVYVRVQIPKPFGPKGDGGVGKDKVKELKWSWQQIQGGPVFKESWIKRIKENEFEALQKETPYPISIVQHG